MRGFHRSAIYCFVKTNFLFRYIISGISLLLQILIFRWWWYNFWTSVNEIKDAFGYIYIQFSQICCRHTIPYIISKYTNICTYVHIIICINMYTYSYNFRISLFAAERSLPLQIKLSNCDYVNKSILWIETLRNEMNIIIICYLKPELSYERNIPTSLFQHYSKSTFMFFFLLSFQIIWDASRCERCIHAFQRNENWWASA